MINYTISFIREREREFSPFQAGMDSRLVLWQHWPHTRLKAGLTFTRFQSFLFDCKLDSVQHMLAEDALIGAVSGRPCGRWHCVAHSEVNK